MESSVSEINEGKSLELGCFMTSIKPHWGGFGV